MQRSDHLPVLDGVRLGCALAVLAYHLCTVFPLAASSVLHDFPGAPQLPAALAGYSWWGWVGVELFFVVSGYVIAGSAASAGPATFLRRRALRLLPAAWLCATLTALVLLAGSTLAPLAVATRWAGSMLLFPLAQPIDEIYWTLGVEVAFYALVATILRERDNRSRLEWLGAMLGTVSLVFWTGQAAGAWTLDAQATPVRLLLLPHGGFFAIGLALRALSARRRGRAVAIALATGPVAAIAEIVAQAATMRGVAGFTPDPLIPLAVFAVGVGALACAPHFRGGGHTARLGALTYPLYLLNQRFVAGVVVALAALGPPPGWAVAGAALVVAGLAWAIADQAEPRLRRWLARGLTSIRATRTDTPPTASLPAG